MFPEQLVRRIVADIFRIGDNKFSLPIIALFLFYDIRKFIFLQCYWAVAETHDKSAENIFKYHIIATHFKFLRSRIEFMNRE